MDYKIAAKAIANRLLSVLSLVIHSDQSCGVPGRNPNESSRLLKDIVCDANQNGVGAAVLSLDQEKAFDRVEWSYLLRVLQQMNFGDSFRQWISLFYSHIFSCIQINGELTELFRVTRGVRQGCPLSPLLYVIMAETIACAIRADPQIDGYPIPRTRRAKICQYADDTTIVVLSDTSLRAVFSLFNRYELASGARLNVSKSHGLLIGPWRSRSDLPVSLDWSSACITVLGSRLSNDGEENWERKVQDLDSVLTSWSSRSLSFHGRALIVNSLGLSMFWYLLSFTCLPDQFLQRINTSVFSFVWKRKREWLARSSVMQRPTLGGLGVVDVKRKIRSLHVLWIRRFVEHQNLPWAFFFKRYLTIAFAGQKIEQILLLKAAPKSALASLPPFYRSVLESWFSLSRSSDGEEIVITGPGSSSCQLLSLTARFAYHVFSTNERTQHRCVEKFQSWGLAPDWRGVWASLHFWRFIRPVRDTSWFIAHGILPTADRLRRFGMNVSPVCHCGQVETLVHLFVDCSFAKQFFSWYSLVHRRHTPAAGSLSPVEVLVGYGRSVKIPPVFPCLLGILCHHIWKARNAYRFDRSPVNYDVVLANVKASLRFNLHIQHRQCSSAKFPELWLANGIFGYVTKDDDLVFPEEFW